MGFRNELESFAVQLEGRDYKSVPFPQWRTVVFEQELGKADKQGTYFSRGLQV
jgi:hypothetical protein